MGRPPGRALGSEPLGEGKEAGSTGVEGAAVQTPSLPPAAGSAGAGWAFPAGRGIRPLHPALRAQAGRYLRGHVVGRPEWTRALPPTQSRDPARQPWAVSANLPASPYCRPSL